MVIFPCSVATTDVNERFKEKSSLLTLDWGKTELSGPCCRGCIVTFSLVIVLFVVVSEFGSQQPCSFHFVLFEKLLRFENFYSHIV